MLQISRNGITSSISITPERLPPSSNSDLFRSYNVHLQIIVWDALDTTARDPLAWGWEKRSLENLASNLKNIGLRKMSTRKPYSFKLSSCRKNGLHYQACE